MVDDPKQLVNIKRIKLNDMELLVRLFDNYRVFYQKESDVAGARKFLTKRLSNNESVVFLASVEENREFTPVGFTQLYPTFSSGRMAKNWILNDLFVEPDHRNQGIGKRLIDAAMQFAKDDGATFVKLETAKDNKTAQNVYEGIGFYMYDPHDGFLTYKIDLN